MQVGEVRQAEVEYDTYGLDNLEYEYQDLLKQAGVEVFNTLFTEDLPRAQNIYCLEGGQVQIYQVVKCNDCIIDKLFCDNG